MSYDFTDIFKLAEVLIEDQLASRAEHPQAQGQEPADLGMPTPGKSVLNLLGKTTATTTEPAPKILHVDSGKRQVSTPMNE